MRFTPTTKYLALAYGAAKHIQQKVYVRTTTDLSLALTAGTWVEVTSRVIGLPSSIFDIEFKLGQYQSSGMTLETADIRWWEENVLNYNGFAEVKVELKIGLSESNLATDTVYQFSGLLDRKGIRPSERGDRVSLPVDSYDAYARRKSAESVGFQPLNTNVDGSATTGLILQNIPGVWVTNANVSGFTLAKGIHTLTYEYNGGTEQATLADGTPVTLPSSDDFVTLANGDGTQKVTLYVDVSELSTTTQLTQDLIVVNEGDALPQVWLQRMWAFNMLKDLFAAFGITSYSFDNFQLPTFDGRNITSFFEVPVGTEFYDKTNSMLYDTTNDVLWMGIGDKVYRRSMTDHVYTLIGQVASGYAVKRFFDDLLVSDGEIWGIARNASGAYKAFRVTVATGALSAYDLNGRGAADDAELGPRNFAIAATTKRMFYQDSGGSDSVFYFDLDALTESSPLVILSDTAEPNYAGWTDGTDYFCQIVGSAPFKTILVKIYFDAGVPGWFEEGKIGSADIDTIEEGAYNATEGVFVYFSAAVDVKQYNHAGDSIATVVAAVAAANNFTYKGEKVYLYRGNADKTFSYVVNGSLYSWTQSLTLPDRDTVSHNTFYKIVFDDTANRFIGIFDKRQVLWQFYNRSSMYIDVELDGQGRFIFDLIRDIGITFMLLVAMNSGKKAYAYRRGNDSGNPVGTGNTVVLTTAEIANVVVDTQADEKVDYVEVTNGAAIYSYDGTTFYQRTYPKLGDERGLTINLSIIPTSILQDLAFYLYQYFRIDRDLYQITLGALPLFQYEPFDTAELNIQSMHIQKYGSGLIHGQEIHPSGDTILRVLIPRAGQIAYGTIDADTVA